MWYVTRHTIGSAGVVGVAIHGLGGPDTLQISPGLTLPGGLYGGDDNDLLIGGGGMDAIDGNNGDDRLEGRGGPDYLFGGAGGDFLDGGAGQDYMSGGHGVGADTVSYAGRGESLILRATGNWESGTRTGWLSTENDCIYHDVENITGGNGSDILFANQFRGGEVRGGAGQDTLYGSAYNDRLFGEAGDDVIHGGHGYDFMVGGIGADVFYARGDNVADTVIGANEDGSGGSDYDLAQIDRGPTTYDWVVGIHAFI
jgi:Ca2+-binding RTX toxin-like protein